jgi:hypothetical protein
MTYPGIDPSTSRYTVRQRWSNWLAFGATVLALLLGYGLRNSVMSAASLYEDPSAGITVMRPSGWLVDREGDYVFRLRDPEARPFKTSLLVTVLTIGPDATGRNALDALSLKRAATLGGYRVLEVDDAAATPLGLAPAMRYAYVDSEPDPYLGTLPVVVLGVDVVFFKSDQAIIASYRAAAEDFDAQYFHFERFLSGLRF